MTVLRTAKPFAPVLLGHINSILKADSTFNDLHFITTDGECLFAGLLMRAVSPMLRTLHMSVEEPLTIVLPDFTREEVGRFIQCLLSNDGPQSKSEKILFCDFLKAFGVFLDHEETCQNEEVKIEEEDDHFEPSIFIDDEESMSSPEPVVKKRKRGGAPKTDAILMKEKVEGCFSKQKKAFICSICGTERTGSRSMQQHLLWHERHPNEDYLTCHICQQCGKVCADYNAMKFHVRQVHCARTLHCTQEGCDKVFKTQVALKSHLDIHAGIKNYVCSECGFAFRSKQEMKGHVLRKHSNVKKTIPCELCGKLFRHMSNLKSHFNVHKAQSERSHRCQECNVSFKSEASLKSHMILHDPSRPFKCSKCPLRYKNKDAWVSHESSHDNPRFACQLCDVVYTRKDNLKRHMKDKHSKPSLVDKVVLGEQLSNINE